MKNTSGEQIFLERLLNSHSVFGFEEGASRIYEEYVKQYSSVFRDSLNNCYAVLNPSSDKQVLVEAYSSRNV